MKNIHILPTDKPSRLGYLTKKGKEVFRDLRLFDKLMPNILDSENQNIYITNNEEIKEGDWCLDTEDNIIFKVEEQGHSGLLRSKTDSFVEDSCKKIILTTDLILQKDGVQAIDDEFLEWFVNNSSCEEVKVIDDLKYFNIDELRERHLKGLPHLYYEKIGYKIIIPQKEKPTISEEAKKRASNYMLLKGALEPKEETLEEVAENKYTQGIYIINGIDIYQISRECFIQGANWQAERMYSEKDLKNAFDSAREFTSRDGVVDIHIVLPMGGDMSDLQPLHFTFKEWFNQFKK